MPVTHCACGRILRDLKKRYRCDACRRIGRSSRRRTCAQAFRSSPPVQRPQERRSGAGVALTPPDLEIDYEAPAYDEAGLISSLLEGGDFFELVEDPCPY